MGHILRCTTILSTAPLTRHHNEYPQHCVKTATNALVTAAGDGAKVKVRLDPGKMGGYTRLQPFSLTSPTPY